MPNQKKVYAKFPEIREVVKELRAKEKITGCSITPKSPVFFEIVKMVTSEAYAKRLEEYYARGKKLKHRGSRYHSARDLKGFSLNIGKVVKQSFADGAGKKKNQLSECGFQQMCRDRFEKVRSVILRRLFS